MGGGIVFVGLETTSRYRNLEGSNGNGGERTYIPRLEPVMRATLPSRRVVGGGGGGAEDMFGKSIGVIEQLKSRLLDN